MEERRGLRGGLCIILFTCHRLHSTPLAFRSEYDALMIQSAPVNDWDHDLIEAFILTHGKDIDAGLLSP
jgi:hypothetical protein